MALSNLAAAMGHQVNFYLTPGDMKGVEAAIRSREPLFVLHSESPDAKPRVVDSLALHEKGHAWLSFRLVRQSDLAAVVTRHVAAQGYWTIDTLRSPVLEFSVPFFDTKVLRRGRVYYQDGFYGADEEWVEKTESFRKWGRAVLRATKKCLQRHGGNYIGPEASAWLAESGGKLE